MQAHKYLLIGMLTVALLGFITLMRKEQSIVVIDIPRAIQETALNLAHSKISESTQKKVMARFSKMLPEVIDAYAKSHRKTVINARVLSSQNASDITQEMIEETVKRLKHER